MLVQARLVKRGNENQCSMENVPHVENKTWKSQHLPWTSMDFHVVPGFSILNAGQCTPGLLQDIELTKYLPLFICSCLPLLRLMANC